MRYPASFVTRVKEFFSLSEVIGRRVQLKRQGKEFSACCPFHSEATPSFTVNDAKGFYHCFGCGAHGDVITFLMEYDRLHYKEAIESLARDAGIALPTPDPETHRQYQHEDRLLGLMEAASEWFQNQLSSSVGYAAREYLRKRGLNEETQQTFGIGYAPQQREGLKMAMLQRGFSESQLIECGLLIQLEGRASYDRFRGRVMFPIARADGRIVAFGGRLLEKHDKAPKYLNSPETTLFHKQDVLYNLNRVRQLQKEEREVLVVEGYMDVAVLYAHGFTQAVAPLGTAFGESHLKQLWRYCSEPILCFDGDQAGQKAMLRAANMALPHISSERLLRFCGLPKGEDPDSYVRSSGVQALHSLTHRTLSLSELLWNVYIGNRRFNAPEELATAEQALMKSISEIRDHQLRRRIASAYQNRIWHIARQQALKAYGGQQTASGKQTSREDLIRNLRDPLIYALEQVFALIIRFPALMHEAEVEHAMWEWDWNKTRYGACMDKLLSNNALMAPNRYVMAEYLTREFPDADTRLQRQYSRGIIPAQLYGQDEEEGLDHARRLFRTLKYKIEQTHLSEEIEALANAGKLEDDEWRTQRLLELIKLQQQARRHVEQEADSQYS